ncbi:MAG TPA: oligopeptide transporter, OPT family [Nitrospiraceae bacterium]|nr:oligopeptide transporter, OPT family [Nitrospiraceae bacterium]
MKDRLGPAESERSAPLIPASVNLPEITPKAVVLAVVLSILLAAANAYLGLFAGMTVSASIPAAVVSMTILRLFRQSNILENNIVQTAASSGEALAAGVIFTIPGLLLVGYWVSFDYWQTMTVALVGGLLGVLFTIPLRRALIGQPSLRFPEGVATAEVLKVGAQASATGPGALRSLVMAAVAGGAFKFAESGLRLWTDSMEGAAQVGRSIFYGGINLSPALLAVGFIIGLHTAVVVFLGGVLGWLVLIPMDQFLGDPVTELRGVSGAKAIWGQHVRYVGIGAMLVGGLWTLVQVRGPIAQGLSGLGLAYRNQQKQGRTDTIPRTEQDAKLSWILGLAGLALVLMVGLYQAIVEDLTVAVLLTGIMAVTAFLFSAVAAYMAGLVGSSSNPVSGVTIATIMIASLLLLFILGADNPAGPAAALLVAAVVCCAAAMGGDNLQDLKTGHIVGATPWKQQIMQVVGVASAAIIIVPVLSLLHAKYGIGEASALHPHPLSAPQATLMANLARGVFGGNVPWHLIALGAVIGIAVIAVDQRLAAKNSLFRLPALAVALGMYLPLKLSVTICLGGLLAELSRRGSGSRSSPSMENEAGLLVAAGLVTGEALMGIVLALPVALSSQWPFIGSDPFQLYDTPPLGGWPGLLALAAIALFLYRRGAKAPASPMRRPG